MPLNGPVIQSGVLSETAPLNPNYIELLDTSDLDTIWADNFPDPKPKSLLYSVLRNAMLQEYWVTAANLLSDINSIDYITKTWEQEIIGPQSVTGMFGTLPTAWELLHLPVTGVTNGSVKDFLFSLRTTPSDPNIAPRVATFLEFRESLTHLKTLSAAKLQREFAGTLDLCSYRLDAWITSFATKRLAEMRKASPTGMLYGGYGWVMNLKPAEARTKVTPPSGEQDPVYESLNNPGFMHTPSLTQATTAAVLRSGHLTHARNQTPDDLLAIDLSSERVRLAKWLLDGIRQGQPLGALLGYRFERRLQEAGPGLVEYIAPLRDIAPLVAKKLENTDQPVETIAANNVVDGLELNRRWQELVNSSDASVRQFPLYYLFMPKFGPPPSDSPITAELNALSDAIDAVSDALMAESVYQAVRGNPIRAASTMDSIAGGETPPPELEVVRTPRTGIALTHRLVTLFSSIPELPTEWTAEYPHRADVEPNLNAWAARLLGNPAQVYCLVEQLEPTTGDVLESKEIRLHQLHLAPLDYIYAVEGGQQSEIEQRILYTIMRSPEGFAAGSLLRINPNRKPEWQSNELSYGEFNELLRTARKVITPARAIDAADLNLPERKKDFSVDVDELEKRSDNANDWLSRNMNELHQLLTTPETASLESVRDWMMRAAAFGIMGAVPLSAAGDHSDDREILLAQASNIEKEIRQRFDQSTELVSSFNSTTATPEDRCAFALSRLRIVFGKTFIVLPRFTAANSEELENALVDNAKVLDNDPFASTTWFQRMARVRDGVGRLNAALNYSEALKTGEKLNLTIAQLPYDSNDRWVGLPFKDGKNLPGGKLSLVVQSAAPIDLRQPLTGLLIDEWVEVVPSATETTGIALQYDQPNATPPQAILIAVPPDMDSPWTVWSLQQVLLETLELARMRAIDPDTLDVVGHYLPALFFAFNADGNTTVSTDFTTLK
jgi:hypothetical protein